MTVEDKEYAERQKKELLDLSKSSSSSVYLVGKKGLLKNLPKEVKSLKLFCKCHFPWFLCLYHSINEA